MENGLQSEGEHRAIVVPDLAEQSPYASAPGSREKQLHKVPPQPSPLEVVGNRDRELPVVIFLR